MPQGKLGILITRGALLERGPGGWYLAISPDMSVREVAGLMTQFQLACELVDGADELRLHPINYRIPPTANELADFYERGPRDQPQPIRFVQHELAPARARARVKRWELLRQIRGQLNRLSIELVGNDELEGAQNLIAASMLVSEAQDKLADHNSDEEETAAAEEPAEGA